MPKILEWMDWYYQLEKYYKEHGNIDVPQKYKTENGLKLGIWLSSQKQRCKDAKRRELLNNLGMKWNNHDENWNTYYCVLKEYYEKYGNVDVPERYETKDGIKLGIWLATQRQAYKRKGKSKINEDQIQLLNDLGMRWYIKQETWDNYYNALKEYYEKHGNIDVPYLYKTENNLILGKWLYRQRFACKDVEREKLLNKLGMKWEVKKETWDEKEYALEEYYKKHGNIDVPVNYETEEGIRLGIWLRTQRQTYKGKGTSKITQEQIQLLNDLNIEWSICDTKLLNMKIEKENKDKYYRVLENRISHVLTDISYEVSNEITEENQKELCKQIIKRMWR